MFFVFFPKFLFFYGQSGTRKTYTFGTSNQSELLSDDWGIVLQVGQKMMRQLAGQISVFIKIFEVGVDGVKNLLTFNIIASLGKAKLQTELDGGRAAKRSINNQETLLETIKTAQTNRKFAVTRQNTKSSRTHAFYEF